MSDQNGNNDQNHPPFRDSKGRFLPGNPGKLPGTKRKITTELAELCEVLFYKHFQSAVENVMASGRVDMQVRLIQFLADRFAGKPRQDIGVELETSDTASALFADLMRKVSEEDQTDPTTPADPDQQ
jgi:hypothetical protein